MTEVAAFAKKIGMASKDKDLQFAGRYYDDIPDNDAHKEQLTKMAEAASTVNNSPFRSPDTSLKGYELGNWYKYASSSQYFGQITAIDVGEKRMAVNVFNKNGTFNSCVTVYSSDIVAHLKEKLDQSPF